MPLLPYGYEVSLHQNCEWNYANIPLNDRGNQRVTFRFQECLAKEKRIGEEVIYSPTSLNWNYTHEETEYGRGIYAYRSSPKKKNIQFGIAKLGPLSKERFIDMYLEMHKVNDTCEVLKQDSYAYTIIRSDYRAYVGFDIIENEPWNEFMARRNMYRQIHGKRGIRKCMRLPTLIFANDIVFVLPYNRIANGIDYQSVKFMSES